MSAYVTDDEDRGGDRCEPVAMHSSVATSPPHEHPAALLASVSDLGDLRMIVVATAPLEGTERISDWPTPRSCAPGWRRSPSWSPTSSRGGGIGHLLAQAAAALAARHGARRLKADISGGGVPALGVMRGLGPTVSTWEDGSSVAYATLPAPAEDDGRDAVGPFGSFAERFGGRRAG